MCVANREFMSYYISVPNRYSKEPPRKRVLMISALSF
nr:MAG TPA: hypothetical protein [Caudoviricetes sp.]